MKLFQALLAVTFLWLGTTDNATAAPVEGYSADGEQTCIMCHNNDLVNSIKSTKHWDKSNPKTPAATQACESCHGPSAAHASNPMGTKSISFKADTPADVKNANCTNCHNDEPWKTQHQPFMSMPGATCSNCHKVHEAKWSERRLLPGVAYKLPLNFSRTPVLPHWKSCAIAVAGVFRLWILLIW